MPQELMNLPDWACKYPHTIGTADDFEILNAAIWNNTKGGTGTGAVTANGTGGVLVLGSGATSGGVSHIAPVSAIHACSSSNPIHETTIRFKVTEGNTDDAIVFVGIGDSDNNEVVTPGGAFNVSLGFAAGLYKIAGEARYTFATFDGSTSIKTITELTRAEAATWTTLRITCEMVSGVIQVTPWIDAAGGYNFTQPREYGTNPRTPLIKHDTAKTSSVVGFQPQIESSSSNVESMALDYVTQFTAR